jgi:putative ABC transport system substrate-binding protein
MPLTWRVVALTLSLTIAPPAAETQQAGKVYRVGIVSVGTDPQGPAVWAPFLGAMRGLGYVEGKNLVVEGAFAAGQSDRLPALLAELGRKGVDVIVTSGTRETLAAKQATLTTPIVMTYVPTDPVAAGLVVSLARPGGNITGLTLLTPSLSQKYVELLKETVPGAQRFAVVASLPNPIPADRQGMEAAEKTLGMSLTIAHVRSAGDLEPTLGRLKQEQVGGIICPIDAVTLRHRRDIVRLTAMHQMPAIYGVRDYVETGGLMAYGASLPDLRRRAAAYVNKILNGTNPRRSANRAAHQVRAGDQPQDRQSARSHHSALAAAARGPGHRMMDRRSFLVVGAGALVTSPRVVEAQQTDKVARIGVLSFSAPDPFREGFRRALVDLGYVEGRNVVIEHRWADGQTDRLPMLAAALVRANMSLIVASATPSVQAAIEATRHIPIIMAAAGDALRTGLVTNLARPGGNVTGLSLALIELAGKTVELLREALPRATRFACVVHREDPLHREFLGEAESSARRLGLELRPSILESIGELDIALGSLARDRVGGVVVQPIFTVDPEVRSRLVRLTLKHRLPAVSGLRRFAEAGGLVAYASEFSDLPKRAATYVDKILKGAKPADLPVEQPTKFELVINLKTAKALGLTIPPSLLLRADQIIE